MSITQILWQGGTRMLGQEGDIIIPTLLGFEYQAPTKSRHSMADYQDYGK